MCLRKSENANKSNGDTKISDDDDDESIDIEGESFEEYEWAGQKRIRVSSLLDGGYSGIGIGSNNISGNSNNTNNSSGNSNNNNDDDEDEDLNVDGDDSQIYGPPQYTERDIILQLNSECDNENNSDTYLRRLVTGEDVTATNISRTNSLTTTSSSSSNTTAESDGTTIGIEIENNHNKNLELHNRITIEDSNNLINIENSNHIIESLKAKIREYENQIQNKIKCLICMDEFHNPAVSICCWHVHCEECWLRTLGARKLCPQCNMITSPTDLRRIYM